jgi:hypothetical protein
MRYTVPVLGV